KASLQDIAAMLGATIEGDPSTMIDDLAGLDVAGPSALSFFANPKYEQLVYRTHAAAVLVSHAFSPKQSVPASLLRVEDPYLAFTQILEMVAAQMAETGTGVHASAVIETNAVVAEDAFVGAFAYVGPGAIIGPGARIYPHAYIGKGVVVGDNSHIFPHATIYHGCKIGKSCIVHAGTVVGADGFGFAPQADGSYRKIPQLGIVELADGVELGANSCIDRATTGKTYLKAGAKVDNLVQIAHNVEIGEHSVIAAQTGISGSTVLGKGVMVGGQAGFVGHISIADGTKVDAQSGVNKTIKEPGQAFRGSPIQPHRNQLKSELMFRKLVEMEERIRFLESVLQEKDLT
ncbi:MAG: UDP-3-O-(3-hydroxymyristoyl)glucosamine N-acyltransferase, partial [Bacteroidia bacterium]|nr:UDP-3-O-(3-hydroxymyristoyl)glucosamine N-acyltransferase [Bacteroidia bacterium]